MISWAVYNQFVNGILYFYNSSTMGKAQAIVDVPSNDEVEDQDQSDFDGMQEYVTKEELKKELITKISAVEGDKKRAFVALYQLYENQEALDEQRDKELDEIKHKYRLKTEDILNKLRKVVSGESAETDLISKVSILTAEQKAKGTKGVALPDYWPTLIKNSSFAALIQKVELPAIDAITNVIMSQNPTTRQLSIQLHFGDNSIFTNKTLKAVLTEDEHDNISHTYDTPSYKPHYVRAETGLLSMFGQLPEQQLEGLFEYWMNFYNQEMPLGLAFYFQLREGSFNKGAPFGFPGMDDSDEDQEPMEEEQANAKGGKNKKKEPSVQKPECRQQ